VRRLCAVPEGANAVRVRLTPPGRMGEMGERDTERDTDTQCESWHCVPLPPAPCGERTRG